MAITFVKEVGEASSAASATTIAITVPVAGVAAGNCIVVSLGYDSTTFLVTPSCTDSKGNTYTLLGTQVGSRPACAMLVATNVAALVSGDTITVTFASVNDTAARSVVVGEFNSAGLTLQTKAVGNSVSNIANNATASLYNAGAESCLFIGSHISDTGDESMGVGSNTSKVGDVGGTSRALVGQSYRITSSLVVAFALTLTTAASHGTRSVGAVLYQTGTPQISQNSAAPVDSSLIGTVLWTNPANARWSDNSRATVTLTADQNSHYIIAADFNIDLPSNAVIRGIQVEVEGFKSSATAEVLSARVIKNGSVSTTQTKTAALPTTSDGVMTFGGPTDLWGIDWVRSDWIASTSGVAIFLASAIAATYSIDHIRVLIYYDIPSMPVWQRPTRVWRYG